jgi:hypothetical protein
VTVCNKKLSSQFSTGRWFSPDTQVSSTNKTDRHDITELLMKVALEHHQTNKINSNHDGLTTSVVIANDCMGGCKSRSCLPFRSSYMVFDGIFIAHISFNVYISLFTYYLFICIVCPEQTK